MNVAAILATISNNQPTTKQTINNIIKLNVHIYTCERCCPPLVKALALASCEQLLLRRSVQTILWTWDLHSPHCRRLVCLFGYSSSIFLPVQKTVIFIHSTILHFCLILPSTFPVVELMYLPPLWYLLVCVAVYVAASLPIQGI